MQAARRWSEIDGCNGVTKSAYRKFSGARGWRAITKNFYRQLCNADKIYVQFFRYVRHWSVSGQQGPFRIRYLFRGDAGYHNMYWKALQAAVADAKMMGLLPPSFRLPRSHVQFLGLGKL